MRYVIDEELARDIDSRGPSHQSDARFYGLYRGVCVDNRDPHVLRRVRVRVSEFYGNDPKLLADISGFANNGLPVSEIPWALPCLPPNIIDSPSVGDTVWVKCEKGDINRPVWVGVFRTAQEIEREAQVSSTPEGPGPFVSQEGVGTLIASGSVDEQATTKKYAITHGIDARFLWAIRRTENGRPGREFGVLNRRDAVDFNGQADISAATVQATLKRYQQNMGKDPVGEDGRYTESFLQYFSQGGPGYPGYAPLNASNDPNNLNANHLNNLKNFYASTNFS